MITLVRTRTQARAEHQRSAFAAETHVSAKRSERTSKKCPLGAHTLARAPALDANFFVQTDFASRSLSGRELRHNRLIAHLFSDRGPSAVSFLGFDPRRRRTECLCRGSRLCAPRVLAVCVRRASVCRPAMQICRRNRIFPFRLAATVGRRSADRNYFPRSPRRLSRRSRNGSHGAIQPFK